MFIILFVLRYVIPHVGMWIEMKRNENAVTVYGVIPHVGMWIEIFKGG